MSIEHPFDLDGPATFACAQSKCPECQDTLVRQHEGLVHVVLRRQSRGDVPYEDLLQEGRIALWQAVLRPVLSVQDSASTPNEGQHSLPMQEWPYSGRYGGR
jgi:hypothetical protein